MALTNLGGHAFTPLPQMYDAKISSVAIHYSHNSSIEYETSGSACLNACARDQSFDFFSMLMRILPNNILRSSMVLKACKPQQVKQGAGSWCREHCICVASFSAHN